MTCTTVRAMHTCMHPDRSMEPAAIAEEEEEQPPPATSAANHEVRLHIGATAPPAKTITVAAPGPGDLPQKGPYRLRRVPQWVRDANKDAYAPKFMCFGPYHYYDHVGLRHEELKVRYATELLQDAEPREELREICEQRLREMQGLKHRFYADLSPTEAMEMTTEAWVKMMFLDGCFILKHLHNYARGIDEPELHQSRWAPPQLRSDLTLLENQIPFAVLLELFDHLAPRDLMPRIADKKNKRRKLLDMALWYMFRGSLSTEKRSTDELGVDAEVPVDHLLHLLHLAHYAQLKAALKRCRPPEGDLRGFVFALPIRLMRLLRCLCMCDYESGPAGDIINRNGHMTENVPSAAELKAMGIWITRTTTTTGRTGPHHDGTLLDVRFMEDRVRLEIPPLYVEQTTAPLLQNLIAFEQQVGVDGGDIYTTYAFLMYNLVSTREDITLLQDLRILHNNFGSDKKVINYFKNLCVWNRRSGSTPIDDVLKVLRRCRVLHVYRDLAEVKNYINSPVKILLLIISAMVAFSTVMQALMAIRTPTGH